MSYSNNWDISGITGLTNLKDCYQWNGEKRLYDFGMLRLRDDEVIKSTNNISVVTSKFPLYVNSNNVITNLTNYGKSYYYKIPHFLIQNKNLCAIGTPTFSDTEDAYNSSQLSYIGGSASNAKNWRFRLYPSILSFVENFSHWSRDNCSISSVRLFDYGYYEKSGKWVSQVKDEPSNTRFLIARYSTVINGTNDSYANIRWDRYTWDADNDTNWEEWTASFCFYYDISSTPIYFTDLTQTTFSNDALRDAIFWKNNFHYTSSGNSYGEDWMKASAQGDAFGSKTTQKSSLVTHGYCWLPYYTNIMDGFEANISCEVRSDKLSAELYNAIALNFHASDVHDSIISTLTFSGSGDRWSDVQYNIDNSKIRFTIDYGPLVGWYYHFGLISSWYNLNWVNDYYSCPIVLSNEPALNFERLTDSRNNNSYCYKVYQGADVANVSNTGGSIQIYAYIDNTPELITLTLSSDSDTTYKTLSNGGKIYWDGISHGQATDGCVVYEQPEATWGSWEGFGPHATLCPTTVEYFENPGTIQHWKYFSGWEIYGGYIYGKLITLYTQDGSTIMKVDTDATHSHTTIEHKFTTGTIVDWNQHPVNILYSRLEWGYDPNNLTYIAEYSDTQLIPITKVVSSDYNPEGYENYAPYYELTGTVPSTITVLLTTPTELRSLHTVTISGHYTIIASYSSTTEGVNTTKELIYDSDTKRIFCTYHTSHQDETNDEYGYSDLTVMAVFAAAI